MDQEKIKEGVRLILEGVGEDLNREGLLDTPDRVARMYEEILAGYTDDANKHLSRVFTLDQPQSRDIVLEKDIPFYSLCEHHLLPFYGTAAIAYIPDGKVTGLSKLARCVEVFARRLQLQERMTNQIADAMMETLSPKGVMVVVKAEHLCMNMRGIKKPGSQTVTMACRGAFTSEALQNKVFSLLDR